MYCKVSVKVFFVRYSYSTFKCLLPILIDQKQQFSSNSKHYKITFLMTSRVDVREKVMQS